MIRTKEGHHARSHSRLQDRLAVAFYRDTSKLPAAERLVLQAQMRRAATSVRNIVGGCARRSEEKYLRCLQISYASARKLEY
jgi:four helix bundle protein